MGAIFWLLVFVGVGVITHYLAVLSNKREEKQWQRYRKWAKKHGQKMPCRGVGDH